MFNKRKITFIILLIFFNIFVLSNVLFPQDVDNNQENVQQETNTSKYRFNYFTIGGSLYYFDYVERGDNDEYLDSEKNTLLGFDIRFQVKIKPVVLSLLFEIAKHYTNYDGFYQDGTPVKQYTNNVFFRGELNVGYCFNLYENEIYLIPFIGYGYRYWKREIGGYQREDYWWHYFPIGIKTRFKISNNFYIGLDVSIRIMFAGKIKIFLKVFDSSTDEPTLDLGNKLIFRLEIPFEYYFTKTIGVLAVFWYNYSAIGKSNVYGPFDFQGSPILIWEPKSKTHQYGVTLALAIYF